MERRSAGRRVWEGVTVTDTIIGLGSYAWPLLKRVEVSMSTTVSLIMIVTGVLGFMAPQLWDRWKLRQLRRHWLSRDEAGDLVHGSTAFKERVHDRKPVIMTELRRGGRCPDGELDMRVKLIVERHENEVLTQMLAEFRRQRKEQDGYLKQHDLYHEDTLAEWLVGLADLEEYEPEPDFDPFGFLTGGVENVHGNT